MKTEVIKNLADSCVNNETVLVINQNSSNETKNLLLELDNFELNRNISDRHVEEICQSYINSPESYKGIVEIQLYNKNDEAVAHVVDGNHRLIAAQINCKGNQPFEIRIHFYKNEIPPVGNTIIINNSQRKWRSQDFLISYKKQGVESYVKLYNYIKNNSDAFMESENVNGKLKPIIALATLTNGRKFQTLKTTFSKGMLKISDENILYGENLLSELRIFNHILGNKAFFNLSAIIVWSQMRQITSVEVMEKKLKRAAAKWITPSNNVDSWTEYLTKRM